MFRLCKGAAAAVSFFVVPYTLDWTILLTIIQMMK